MDSGQEPAALLSRSKIRGQFTQFTQSAGSSSGPGQNHLAPGLRVKEESLGSPVSVPHPRGHIAGE